MATGISNQRRGDALGWLVGKTVTQPGNVEVALSTADPGDAAASLAEVGGGVGYTAQAITANTGWGTVSATAGSPSTVANAALMTFGTVTGGGWGALTHVGLFTGTASRTAANFHSRYAITGGPITPNVGATVSIAIGALVLSLTFT